MINKPNLKNKKKQRRHVSVFDGCNKALTHASYVISHNAHAPTINDNNGVLILYLNS